MASRPKVLFVGLSATPWSQGLGRTYKALVKGPSVREMIDAEVKIEMDAGSLFATAQAMATSIGVTRHRLG